ncbi:uncharacterized [Tachysurus ichikawai]
MLVSTLLTTIYTDAATIIATTEQQRRTWRPCTDRLSDEELCEWSHWPADRPVFVPDLSFVACRFYL